MKTSKNMDIWKMRNKKYIYLLYKHKCYIEFLATEKTKELLRKLKIKSECQ